jgi:hypothetical protein
VGSERFAGVTADKTDTASDENGFHNQFAFSVRYTE